MRILRAFFTLVLLAVLGLGVAYYFAGKASGPAITLIHPPVIGQAAPLDVVVETPGGQLDALTVQIQQGGKTFPIYAFDPGSTPLRPASSGKIDVRKAIGKHSQPELQTGTATLPLTATPPA